MPSELDIAWAAGFIDGEGCLSVYRQMRDGRPHHGPKISVANTHREALERLQAVVGGTIYVRTPSRKEWSVLHDLRIQGGTKVFTALAMLVPHLTVKREEAVVLMALCERLRTGRAPRPTSEEELAVRDSLMSQLQLLKRRTPVSA